MTTRKQAQPSEMDKALQLLTQKIDEKEDEIRDATIELEALRKVYASFQGLQHLSEQKKQRVQGGAG